MTLSISAWQDRIGDWAERTFGPAEASAVLHHLREEVNEVADAYGADHLGEEISDCLFLLLRIADIHGIDLEGAMSQKYEVIVKRAWGPRDEHGVIRHVASPRIGQETP